MWGVGPVLLDPFISLFWIFLTSLLVFVGARLLVPTKNNLQTVTFESSLQIVCFSMGSAIFTVIPWMGGLIYWVWCPILMIIGSKEIYKVSGRRAVLIALFPDLIFFGILLFGILFFAMEIIKFITSFL